MAWNCSSTTFLRIGSFFLLGDFLKAFSASSTGSYKFFGGRIVLFIVNFAVSSFFLLGCFFECLYSILDRLAYRSSVEVSFVAFSFNVVASAC
ncbi:MAG: hypothetical protein ACLS48_04080 [[Eubacterium] siraeum]